MSEQKRDISKFIQRIEVEPSPRKGRRRSEEEVEPLSESDLDDESLEQDEQDEALEEDESLEQDEAFESEQDEPDESEEEQAEDEDAEPPILQQALSRFFGGDKVLWVIIIALLAISVLVVYSSTAKMAYSMDSSTSSTEFLKAQLGLILVGGVALLVTHRFNSRFFMAISPWVWGVALVLTAAVYFTGTTVNGAARWFAIGGFRFQPSELLKIGVVMYLAYQLSRRQDSIRKRRIIPTLKFWQWKTKENLDVWAYGGWSIFVPICISCAVILPAHTSSAVIVFLLSLTMLYIGRVSWSDIFRMIKWAFVALFFVALIGIGRSSTAGGRMTTWWDVWFSPRDEVPALKLSDTERAMVAIHDGGILGQGAGQSAVRVEMTHPESDYAFAFFVEEYGIILAIILLALYVWIFFRAFEIFNKCPKKYPAMLALGIALLITGQALLHVMVTLNIIPETGQTLPLISRGGSSLLFTCIGVGMILSVSRQNDEGSHTGN